MVREGRRARLSSGLGHGYHRALTGARQEPRSGLEVAVSPRRLPGSAPGSSLRAQRSAGVAAPTWASTTPGWLRDPVESLVQVPPPGLAAGGVGRVPARRAQVAGKRGLPPGSRVWGPRRLGTQIFLGRDATAVSETAYHIPHTTYYHDNTQGFPQTWPSLSQSAHPWKISSSYYQDNTQSRPKNGTPSRNPRTPRK